MTSELQRILENKKTHRRRLAKAPVSEKLAKLDALRDRLLALKSARPRKGVTRSKGKRTGP